MFFKYLKRYSFWSLIWLLIITVLSTMPSVQLPTFNLLGTDKIAHAAVYGFWVLIMLWSTRHSTKAPLNTREGWGIVAFATVYGALMELVQYTFFPGRVCDFDDMIANSFGATAVWLAFSFLDKKINKLRS